MTTKKQTANIFIKIVAITLSILLLSFVSFCLFFLFAFGGEKFYMTLVVVCFILLLALIPISILGLFRPRTNAILWLLIFLGIVIACITKESLKAYHNSFERLDETEVDLTAYTPFGENTLAVDLDTISLLKLDTLLPRMDGATALYPIYAAFARAVYPEKDYPVRYRESEVSCHTTREAYDALIDGRADIIFVLYPSQQQLKYAHEKKIRMKLTPIGQEAFVFFVNSENLVDNLTTIQLKEIYSGKTRNWKEVGGEDSSIKAFQREKNSGSQTAFLRFMEGTKVMEAPREDVVQGMGGIINRTADYTNYPNAIGYSFRFYADKMVGNGSIKLLSIDGIYPDRESIQNGSYPLSSEFYAVTRENETNPNVQLLLDWILSKQGQYLVEKTGYNRIRQN
ncbi:MAG: substrate-binding domain-containing protein [Bacteroides sp.]|nr:substrate-binding domain-containing protein [Bacteroides sp.]